MHRTPNFIFPHGLAALLLCALLSVSAWSQEASNGVAPEGAEQRLAELAERYAGAADESSKPVAAESVDTESAEIEDTPLGFAAQVDDSAASIEPPAGGWALSTLAALGVVIAMIFGARWLYTKMGGAVVARPSPVVEVLSRTPVAPKNHVLLLRVGQRVLVVGDSSSGLNTLADVTDPEEVASLLQAVSTHSDRSVSKNFNSLVSRFNTEYDGKARVGLEGGDASEVHLDRTRDSLSGLASKLRNLGGRGGAV
ncbi:FliO/MopB family protein [Algisphaera agarilytica]|uniref:Flagellar biogenesis protein FliO n=1 Tax=Algisphaera agarilytica TaxID=1385975 RepID=A0A7X0H7M2_9BACT|nr:flagellar biosynthetic protein FliO [Algisphaera agarilytica]MBB6430751.1 flagellar biogenesis protein FliO [Algisphaera agarilytica]